VKGKFSKEVAMRLTRIYNFGVALLVGVSLGVILAFAPWPQPAGVTEPAATPPDLSDTVTWLETEVAAAHAENERLLEIIREIAPDHPVLK
jgi:hypothetical protein